MFNKKYRIAGITAVALAGAISLAGCTTNLGGNDSNGMMDGGGKFNALVWKVSMQARFRDDYTERKETQLTGANGGAVQVETKAVDTDALSADQRNALRELILAAKSASK